MESKITDLCYRCRTIGNPQPYYYYPSKRVATWVYNASFTLVDPPDGFYANPPAPLLQERSERSGRSVMSRSRTVAASKAPQITPKYRIDDQVARGDNVELSLLEGRDAPSMEFMKNPYIPSDIFVLFDGPKIKRLLSDIMELSHWSVKPQTVEEIVNPSQKTLHGTILKVTDSKLGGAVTQITSTIRSYVLHANKKNVISTIESLEKYEGLSPEIINDVVVFLIAQTNSRRSTNSVKNAWAIFTAIISRYVITDQLVKKILRSYFAIVASCQDVSNEVRNYALICLFRVSSPKLPKIQFDPKAPLVYFEDSCSHKRLFGVPLAEVVFKERILDDSERKSTNLVPYIVRKIVSKLIQLGASKTRDIFKQTITHTEKMRMKESCNKGNWEIDITNVHTTAAILKYFLSTLQEPIIPNEYLPKLKPDLEGYKCVKVANSLPNPNADTLKYLIGFLQELSLSVKETRMDEASLAKCFVDCLAWEPDNPTTEELFDHKRKVERFILCLIINWRTDEVYIKDDTM